MNLRHLQTAPTFMSRQYDTEKEWSWAFGGFNFPRASFYPDGRRTPEAIGQLCGSPLACLSSKFLTHDILTEIRAFDFLSACASAITGFELLEEDVKLEAVDVMDKLPDRQRVQQVIHGVTGQHVFGIFFAQHAAVCFFKRFTAWCWSC